MPNPTITQADTDNAEECVNNVRFCNNETDAIDACSFILARHREAHSASQNAEAMAVIAELVDGFGAMMKEIEARGYRNDFTKQYAAIERARAFTNEQPAAHADGFWEAKDKAWLAVQARIDNYLAKHRNENPSPAFGNELRFAIECLQIAQDDIAALKPSDAPADGWRDISTAPKDGTEILLYHGADEEGDAVLVSAYWNSHFKKWWSAYHNNDDLELNNPTHWMPLPAAPANDNGGKG